MYVIFSRVSEDREISTIRSGRKVPVVSIYKIRFASFAQLAASVKHSCDFPEPLSPKISVIMPVRIPPPPNNESISFEPVDITGNIPIPMAVL